MLMLVSAVETAVETGQMSAVLESSGSAWACSVNQELRAGV